MNGIYRQVKCVALSLPLAVTALTAHAATFPPLGPVKGVVLKDFQHHDTFLLGDVAVDGCDISATDDLRTATCKVAGDQRLNITSDDDGREIVMKLTKVAYVSTRIDGLDDTLDEYHFFGTYNDVVDGVPISSDTQLMLSYFETTPADVHGWVELTKYNLRYPVQAMRH